MELEEENEFVEEPGVHEPRFGGYDFVFVDELALGQTCSVCLVAMRNPVQTMCGHRFCEDCLLGTFRWHVSFCASFPFKFIYVYYFTLLYYEYCSKIKVTDLHQYLRTTPKTAVRTTN